MVKYTFKFIILPRVTINILNKLNAVINLTQHLSKLNYSKFSTSTQLLRTTTRCFYKEQTNSNFALQYNVSYEGIQETK